VSDIVTACVYDNPATWRREAYQDGKKICDVSAQVLLQKGFKGHRDFPWILNCGPWQEGKIWGDSAALTDPAMGESRE
jgi:hypothetical protein